MFTGMDTYKVLNKELVETVQELKSELGKCHKEILLLKSENMEKCVLAVALQSKISKMVDLSKKHYQEYMSVTKPNVGEQNDNLEISVGAARLPRSLAEENRRSSLVVRTRNSFINTSPIRVSSDQESHASMEENRRNSTNSNSPIRTSSDEQVIDADKEYNKYYGMAAITEDDCEINEENVTSYSDETESYINVSHSISHEQSWEESVSEYPQEGNNTRIERTLREVTNIAENKEIKVSENKGQCLYSTAPFKPLRCVTTRDREQKENNINLDEETTENIESFGCSIDEVRQNLQDRTTKAGSFRLGNQSGDSTIAQFDELLSSTPVNKSRSSNRCVGPKVLRTTSQSPNNSAQPSTKCKSTTIKEPQLKRRLRNNTSDNLSTSQSQNNSARPSRKCKPTTIKEPTLKTKLRNNNSDNLPKKNKTGKRK